MDATVNNNNNSNPNSSPAATAQAAATKAESAEHAGSAETEAEQDGAAPAQRGRKRRLGVDPSLIISDGRSKRRKSPTPEVADATPAKNEVERDPKDKVRAESLGREIYQNIMASEEDGEKMSEPFIKLPSKKQFPDYYATIKNPMCLDTVRSKLDKQEYETLKEVITDLGQIFTNAKRYNTKDSQLFQWAKKLHKLTRTFYAKITEPDANAPESEDEGATGPSSGPSKPRLSASALKAEARDLSASVGPDDEDVDMGGPSNASMDGESVGNANYRIGRKRGSYMKEGPTVYKLVKPIVKIIRDARSTDGKDREISAIFETLPDKKDLPDYYSAIRNPISLEEISTRVDARRYETYQEFFDQADLMCLNAMQYNEDDSDVFRDAQQIKGILDVQRADIQRRLSQPVPQKSKPRTSAAPSASRPEFRQPAPRELASPYPGYSGTSPHPVSTGLPSASPAPSRPYLIPLPLGQISEEIAARVPQYSAEEQSIWAKSLSPQAMNQYRQILAKTEARRRTLAGQPPVPVIDPASAVRPTGSGAVGANGSSASAQPFNLAYRTKPLQPMIKHLDFAFNTPVPPSEGGGKERHTIRIYNLRGVVTHCLIIGADTAEVEITAMLASASASAPASASAAGADGVEAVAVAVPTPEVRLRVNGNPGSTAKQVYAEVEAGEDGPSTEAAPGTAGTESGGNGTGPESTGGVTTRGKPIGMRWTVPIAHSRMETRLDFVCSLAGKSEQCGVYISRQF